MNKVTIQLKIYRMQSLNKFVVSKFCCKITLNGDVHAKQKVSDEIAKNVDSEDS